MDPMGSRLNEVVVAVLLLVWTAVACQALDEGRGEPDPIVGRWQWFNGQVMVFDPGATVNGETQNRWRLADPRERKYEVRWAAGRFVDTLVLAPDGKRLSGQNQEGVRVTAERLAPVPRRMRLLVDRARSKRGGDGVILLNVRRLRKAGREVTKPRGVFVRRLNYGLLRSESLREFDVLAVATTDGLYYDQEFRRRLNMSYADEERAAVREFVTKGGGLLMTGNGFRWAQRNRAVSVEAQQAPLAQERMTLNQLAGAFGVMFTAERPSRRDRKNLRIAAHPCYGERGVAELSEILGSGSYCVLSVRPEIEAEALVADGSGRPLAVAFRCGEGRVVAVGADMWSQDRPESYELASDVLTWLGEGRLSAQYGQRAEPETVESSTSIERDGFRLLYNPQIEYRATAIAPLAERSLRFTDGLLAGSQRAMRKLSIRLIIAEQGGASGKNINVSALGPLHRIAGVVAHERAHQFYRGVREEYFAHYIGIRARMSLGYPDEARAIIAAETAAFRAEDPKGDGIDIMGPMSRAAQGKYVWMLEELEKKHGPDFIGKFFARWRQDVSAPRSLDAAHFVQYMSEAAGEDLAPWFKALGTTTE